MRRRLVTAQVVGRASRLPEGRLALHATFAGETPDEAGGTPAPLPELRRLSRRLALFGAYAVAVHAASAQTWQTVDDYVVVTTNNTYGAEAYAMAKDPSGNLFAAGYVEIDGDYDSVAAIRKSSDGGATWSFVDFFSNGDASYPEDEYTGIV